MEVHVFKNQMMGSSHCGAMETNKLGTMRLRGQFLALLSGLKIWRCRELWCRSLAAITPIRSLAWELPCAVGVALRNQKTKKFNTMKWFHIHQIEPMKSDNFKYWRGRGTGTAGGNVN